MRSLLSLALLGFSGATPAEGYESQSSVKNWFDLLRACPKVASACQVPTARFPSSTNLNAARDCVKAHLNSEQRGPCYDAMDKFSRVSTKLSSQDDRRDNDDDDDDDDKWSRKWGGEKTKWWGREEGSKDDKQRPSFDEGDKHRRSEDDKDRRPSFDKEDKDKDDKHRRPSLNKDDKNEDGKHWRPFPFNKNKDDKDQRSSSNKDSKDDKRRPSFDKNDKDDKHMPRSPFDQDDERRSDKHMPRPPFDRDDERRPRPPFDKDDKPMPQSPFDRDGHGPRPPFGPLPFDQDDERRPRPSFDWDDERRSDKHMSRPPFDKDDNRSPFKRSPFDGKHWPWPLFEEDNKQMPPFDKRSPFDDWSRPSFDKDDQHWPRLPFDKDDKHMPRPPFDEFMPRFPFDRDMPRLSGFFDMSSKGDNWMPDFQDKRPFPFFPRMDRDMMDFSRPSFSPRSLFLSRLDQDESFPMWGSSPSFSGIQSGLWPQPSFPRQPSLSSFGGQSFGFAFQPSSGLPRPPTFSMSAPLDPMFVRFALSRAPQVQPPFFLGQQQSMPSPGVLQKRPLVLQRTQFKQLPAADSENVEVSDDANDADIYSNDDDAPYSPVQLQFLKIERGN